MAASLRLRPMTDDEYLSYYDAAVASLAEEEARAFELGAEEAHRRSVAGFERLVPNKVLSGSTQRICVIERDRDDVGVIWYELRSMGREAYIYDLLIWPQYRRRGYASQALHALESELGNAGVEKILLNVFDHNEIARTFYEAHGFATRARLMRKTI